MSSATYELKNIQEGEDDNEAVMRSPDDVLVIGGRLTSSTEISSSSLAPIQPHQIQPDDGITRQSIPADIYKFVFIIFLIHGVGVLMPWNMFCTAGGYFREYKLQPATNATEEVKDELKQLRTSWFTYLGIASQVPNLIFSGLNLLVDLGSGNLKIRINLALIIELAIFILTIALASVDSSGWPVAFFYITMASVVLLNIVSGVYQNCIFGTCAKFPPVYTNAVLIGSNLSGTYTSIVSIFSIWAAPEHKTAAIYYFITAVIAILICLISYNLLPAIKFFRHYDNRGNEPVQSSSRTQQQEYMAVNDGNMRNPSDDVPETLRETVDAMVPKPSSETTFMDRLNRKIEIFNKCRGQLFNVWITFFVTLALFPAILADIKPLQDYISKTYFGPITCFLVFNSSALLGNVISYYTSWPGKDRVWILSVARLLFIPFFLFCNFTPDANAIRSWPVLIPSDIVYTIANFLMGVTSGYLSSICMMFVSSGLNQDEAPTAGMLGGFFLVFGIFSGIMSTFLLTRIVYY